MGAPVAAVDKEGDTLKYHLSGAGAAVFTIDSATGQIMVKAGASLDYESKTSYSVTVSVAEDGYGFTPAVMDDTIAVTINVTDVDEPPAAPAAPSVSQNAGTPQTQLDVTWTAPDVTGKPALTGYSVRYRKKETSAWNSQIFVGTGTGTAITGLQAGTEYEVQVKASNAEGASAWSASGEGKTAPAVPTPTPVPTPAPLQDLPPDISPLFPSAPPPPRAPQPLPPTTLGSSACATSHDLGNVMRIERKDGGAALNIKIGLISLQGSQPQMAGFIRDGTLGQTYSVVRYQADGRVARVWVDPDDPIVGEIPWDVVNSQYTVPVCVVAAIPLDDQFPALGQLVRRFDGADERIFRHVGNLVWRHVPDEGTFESMGLYWCNVTAADASFFRRITIGAPLPSSGTEPREGYPSCWTWEETERSR